MTAVSTVVDLGRVSAVVGYGIKSDLSNITGTLKPVHIGILAHANEAEVTAGNVPDYLEFQNSKQVGDLYGYGSTAYNIANLLRPITGDVLGSVKTTIITQSVTGTKKVNTVTVVGTATKPATHFVKVNGRTSINGDTFAVNIETGNTAEIIAGKIKDAINRIKACSYTATNTLGVVNATCKAYGVNDSYSIVMDTNNNSAGITYTYGGTAGTGVPSLTFEEVGDQWMDIIVSAYNDSTSIDSIIAWVGNPNDLTGRYLPTVNKPAVAFVGLGSDVIEIADITAITDTYKDEAAICFCPCPSSKASIEEVAASYAKVQAIKLKDTPNEDVIGTVLKDLPKIDSNTEFGDFNDPIIRDAIVKVGDSTVKSNGGYYEIVDLVTTYHPDTEPQTAAVFRWVRDILGVDNNVSYLYKYLNETFVQGKTIISDTSYSTASNVISPRQWKKILETKFFPVLEDNGLIVDIKNSISTLKVAIGESNPNRFETSFEIKRSGTARVNSTTCITKFNFG